ncbi:MAG TPA: BlaI/MecI/CopY family transcriptional regulator [Terriglobales bacterium]|nr:BlaI/MecI/CopY family transcriptional regulator [Terriglobales bacterium]
MKRTLGSFRLTGERPLGPLELRLLEALWSLGSGTVREMLNAGVDGLAYTTIMTTLDRLHRKGLLDRVSEGKAFRYAPRYSRDELHRAAAGEAIRELFATGGASLPLSYLVEILGEKDAELLDDLQKLVERKQAELRKEAKP